MPSSPRPALAKVGTAGDQAAPIKAERHRVDGAGVAGQRRRQGGVAHGDQGRIEVWSRPHAVGGKVELRREGHVSAAQSVSLGGDLIEDTVLAWAFVSGVSDAVA
jgi:hypothetical protein